MVSGLNFIKEMEGKFKIGFLKKIGRPEKIQT
jgi:hypothetical protein